MLQHMTFYVNNNKGLAAKQFLFGSCIAPIGPGKWLPHVESGLAGGFFSPLGGCVFLPTVASSLLMGDLPYKILAPLTGMTLKRLDKHTQIPDLYAYIVYRVTSGAGSTPRGRDTLNTSKRVGLAPVFCVEMVACQPSTVRRAPWVTFASGPIVVAPLPELQERADSGEASPSAMNVKVEEIQ
ncbi:hypothetical protein Ciccas_013663 [Cichlidogyrus casuarinus]|uniref:Uncharacterized protein n=1 Tax=Cichlidogyrus casuarinus TaxID=1844966 RepID=A0ABD2PL88_9PLAT